MNRIVALVVLVVALLFVASSTLLVVDQRHRAVIYSHSGSNPTVVGPGLHAKWPTPVQSAMLIDTRVQSFEPSDTDRYATSDKTELLVNPVLKYRIVDPLKLFSQTDADPTRAEERLAAFTRAALADALSKRTLADALSTQTNVAAEARDAIAKAADALGIEVVDLQLTRVDVPAATADAIYKRMSAAQEQVARDERAQGASDAGQIRADADRSRDAVLADANKEAQAIKGDADAQAAQIAADASNLDPGFYQFFQSLQAYRAVFKPNDVLVVDADSAFFRFMRSPDGSAPSLPPAGTVSRKH
jgi:membrane protease subunit HflC